MSSHFKRLPKLSNSPSKKSIAPPDCFPPNPSKQNSSVRSPTSPTNFRPKNNKISSNSSNSVCASRNSVENIKPENLQSTLARLNKVDLCLILIYARRQPPHRRPRP